MFEFRDGEKRGAVDPAGLPPDAGLVFIGRVSSPWATRADCPKNMAQARQRGEPATVHVDPAWRDGLDGLSGEEAVVLLTWFAAAPRDLVVQKPRRAEKARGTFALRSPARPNPIGLHVARLLSVDIENGVLIIEAIDVLDGTPVIDIKPWRPGADTPGRTEP